MTIGERIAALRRVFCFGGRIAGDCPTGARAEDCCRGEKGCRCIAAVFALGGIMVMSGIVLAAYGLCKGAKHSRCGKKQENAR
jgi:hypothetical protein